VPSPSSPSGSRLPVFGGWVVFVRAAGFCAHSLFFRRSACSTPSVQSKKKKQVTDPIAFPFAEMRGKLGHVAKRPFAKRQALEAKHWSNGSMAGCGAIAEKFCRRPVCDEGPCANGTEDPVIRKQYSLPSSTSWLESAVSTPRRRAWGPRQSPDFGMGLEVTRAEPHFVGCAERSPTLRQHISIVGFSQQRLSTRAASARRSRVRLGHR